MPPRSLGAVLKEAQGTDEDEDTLNEAWAAELSDTAKRGKALQHLREVLPETKDMPDEKLWEDALRRTGKRQWALPSDPQRSKEIQKARRTMTGVDQYVANRVASKDIQQSQGEPAYAREKAVEHDERTLTPKDVTSGVTRQFETQDEMEAEAKAKGLKVVNAGNAAFPTLQLQDDRGNTMGQLNPSATRSQSRPDIGNVTGQSSVIQKMATQALERVYDPRTQEWFKDTPGSTPLFTFGFDPQQAEAMQRGFESTAKSSRGLREYGADVGARVGEAFPKRTAFGNRIDSGALAGAAHGLGAVDRAEEAILRGLAAVLPSYTGTGSENNTLNKYAEEQAAEAERYERAGSQLWQNAVEGIPATKEAASELGRGVGTTGGEVASLVAPTEGGPIAGAVLGAGAKLLGAGAKLGGRALAKKFPEEFDTIAGIFSSQPSALVLPESQRAIARGIQSEARNAGDLAEIQFHQRGMDALRQALPGKTDDELQAVMGRATKAWHSPAERLALDPDAATAVATLQPLHEDVFRALFGTKVPYNPLHVYRGQDITKPPRQIETRTAEEAARDASMANAESLADVGSPATAGAQMVAGARGGKTVPGLDPQRAMSGAKDYVPRMGRSWESQAAQLRKIGQEDVAKEVEHLDVVSGLAKTYRMGRQGQGLRHDTAWEAFRREMPNIPNQEAGKYFQRQDLSAVLDHYRRAKGAKITKEMEEQLIKDDNVLLMSDPSISGRNVFHVDNPALSGKVVSKRMAQAVREAAQESEGLRKAQKVAQVMDQVLGTTQWKNIVTRGNPGFNWRQRMNEVWRVANDNPAALSRENLALVQEISNAPVGKGGRYIKELGMTAGEAHEAVLKFGSLSKGFTEDLRAAARETPGPFWMPNVATKGFNKAVDAVEGTSGAAANAAYRRLFPRLNSRYETEAGLRMASMIGHMRQGASPMAAAMRMKNTMLDFSDPSILTTVGGQVIPFLNYQIGAARSVGNLVLRNPRRYSRVYDLMRISENLDTALNDGEALNQKMKLDKDRLSGTPYVREGKQTISALRPETLGSEVASLSGLLTGETPGMSLTSPIIQAAWPGSGTAFTGESANTGRSMYNLPQEWHENFSDKTEKGPLHALRIGREAMRQGQITPTEFAVGLAGQLPGVSRVMDFPPAGLAVRQLSHTANPASRTEDAGVEQLRRSLRSYGTGVRSQTVDPAAVAIQQERRNKIPKTYLQVMLEQAFKGAQ